MSSNQSKQPAKAHTSAPTGGQAKSVKASPAEPPAAVAAAKPAKAPPAEPPASAKSVKTSRKSAEHTPERAPRTDSVTDFFDPHNELFVDGNKKFLKVFVCKSDSLTALRYQKEGMVSLSKIFELTNGAGGEALAKFKEAVKSAGIDKSLVEKVGFVSGSSVALADEDEIAPVVARSLMVHVLTYISCMDKHETDKLQPAAKAAAAKDAKDRLKRIADAVMTAVDPAKFAEFKDKNKQVLSDWVACCEKEFQASSKFNRALSKLAKSEWDDYELFTGSLVNAKKYAEGNQAFGASLAAELKSKLKKYKTEYDPTQEDKATWKNWGNLFVSEGLWTAEEYRAFNGDFKTVTSIWAALENQKSMQDITKEYKLDVDAIAALFALFPSKHRMFVMARGLAGCFASAAADPAPASQAVRQLPPPGAQLLASAFKAYASAKMGDPANEQGWGKIAAQVQDFSRSIEDRIRLGPLTVKAEREMPITVQACQKWMEESVLEFFQTKKFPGFTLPDGTLTIQDMLKGFLQDALLRVTDESEKTFRAKGMAFEVDTDQMPVKHVKQVLGVYHAVERTLHQYPVYLVYFMYLNVVKSGATMAGIIHKILSESSACKSKGVKWNEISEDLWFLLSTSFNGNAAELLSTFRDKMFSSTKVLVHGFLRAETAKKSAMEEVHMDLTEDVPMPDAGAPAAAPVVASGAAPAAAPAAAPVVASGAAPAAAPVAAPVVASGASPGAAPAAAPSAASAAAPAPESTRTSRLGGRNQSSTRGGSASGVSVGPAPESVRNAVGAAAARASARAEEYSQDGKRQRR